MPVSPLTFSELCLRIDPGSLGFRDTSELSSKLLPWIGQERAGQAARFGLAFEQPDYNLFVLGEVGSGRSSLMLRLMQEEAAKKPAPPDLCYLHNFDAPERPLALRLPAGQGRLLRQLLAQLVKTLQAEIPRLLSGPEFKAESERIQKAYKAVETSAYQQLVEFAEARRFALRRESGRLVFTLLDEQGQAMPEEKMLTLPRERKAAAEQAEQELRAEIVHFFERMRPREREMLDALAALRRRIVAPQLERETGEIRAVLQGGDRLDAFLARLNQDVLNRVGLFEEGEADEEARQEELNKLLSRCRANLLVDNGSLSGAPALVEGNPLFRSLFGSIEYQVENDVLVTDFTRIRAGSLLRAHGGFLLLHLRDLLSDVQVWEKLRRFLRSGRLQIEEPGTATTPIAAVSLEPEAVDVEVKIILIGSREQYYELQEADPEFSRHFRTKVDFAESFRATAENRFATAVFIAHVCEQRGLPHFSAAAVARLLEATQREVEDQFRQSAAFGRLEAMVMESAAICASRKGEVAEAEDVEAALQARIRRHNYPEQQLLEEIRHGGLLINVRGALAGQLNGLTQADFGDHRFGYPVRITARTHAGDDGLVNIEREVELSGPNHDKGVFILQNYLAALFAHIAPLCLNASLVFEQEYHGVEGDSASCAELYALLSALSGVPLRQGIAVTGALNQHGEALPVGGVNEKIEGYFRVCELAGLDGSQGVLIPSRNRRNLMLSRETAKAVEQGLFHIYSMERVDEGIELLTGIPVGLPDQTGRYPHGTVLGLAQQTLQAYHRACQAVEHHKPTEKPGKPGHR